MKRDLYGIIAMLLGLCCLTLIFYLSIYAAIGMNYASLQYRLTRTVELVLDILVIIIGFLIISSILYDMCNKDKVVDVKKKNIIFHILSFLTVFSLILNAFVIILSLSFKMNFDNKTESYLNIYKNNDEYILSTGKYMEDNKKEYEYNGNTYYLGSRIYDGDLTDDDKTKLANQINSLLPVALKYDYKFFYNSSYNSNYYSNCISGIIAIDDFNEFYQPLKKGNFPKERNEILIYDYLEESLIKSGYISDDAIGKKIYDESNNYEFVITGVINSNYKKYAYLENRKFKGEFQESYLNELSSIYVSNKYFQNDANHKRIGLYILLKKDWNYNKTVLEKLEWPSRNDDYYANLKDGEIYYGYVIKSPYSDALTSGKDNIVIRTNNIINHLNIVLIFSNILSLAYVIYWIFKDKVEGTFNDINKNKMKWLILKLLFIFALSLFMAIPISYGVIEAFNNSYIIINKLYSIDVLAIAISSLINFGIVVIGYLCVLLINEYISKRNLSI